MVNIFLVLCKILRIWFSHYFILPLLVVGFYVHSSFSDITSLFFVFHIVISAIWLVGIIFVDWELD
jgi:hypothetical protein